MAKLFVKFEQAVVKEQTLGHTPITIGRLPDNQIHIDNLAVSGHHARISWDADHYVLEDLNSLNGTYVNNHKVGRVSLKHGDKVLVGKHMIEFVDDAHAAPPTPPAHEKTAVALPEMEKTVVLSTRQAQEQIAHGGAAAAPAPSREVIGILRVLSGRTDQQEYVLTDKLNVIGKSEMASIKLRGWFAPKVAAVVHRKEHKYYIAASEKKIRVRLNGEEIAGQRELSDGDTIDVWKIQMTFTVQD
jgi:pSer/pThr/pTyr-binding forkhead associated (FHA) protein